MKRSAPPRWCLALALVLVGACGGGDPPVAVTPDPAALTAVTVSPNSVALLVGATEVLTPTPTTGGPGVSVSYAFSTSAPSVASVTTAGMVTAIAPGTATITVSATGSGNGFTASTQQATATVTVSALPPAITALTVTPNNVSLVSGGVATLTPLPVTAGAGVGVTYVYSSNAPAVATVNSAGLVSAVAPGTATITVTATGSGNGLTTTQREATATVTVTAPPAALTAVSVTPDSVALVAGANTTLTPVPVTAGAGVSVTYAYATSASSVATVNGAGVVSAVAPGTATITITATGSGTGFTTTVRQTSAKVTVSAAPPLQPALLSLAVSPPTLALSASCSATISAVATPGGAGVAVMYSFASSVAAVATVNGSGVVSAVSSGTAAITVTASGTGSGFAPVTLDTTVNVTVSPAAASLGIGFDCSQFALIPAGSFQMGATNISVFERPVRTVTISKPFLLQRTEVTQAQWRQVMQGTGRENPSGFAACGNTCPVETVTWNDIPTFLARLNAQDPGKNYRLPTEAEWEYAARAGTTGDYGGNGVLDDMGWHLGNSGQRTHPVAQKLANAFGLFDMHGNVFEWVNDWMLLTYYQTGPSVDPPGPASGTTKVNRGGSHNHNAVSAMSARRNDWHPEIITNTIGLRLARDP